MPKYLVPIDLNNNELQNFLLHNLPEGSIPASNRKGQFLFDTTNNIPKWNSGSGFNAIYPGSTSRVANTFVLRDSGGNHSATSLEVARDFSITGKATASGVSFNGSGNVALNITSLNVDPGEIALSENWFLLGNSSNIAEATQKANIPISGFGQAESDVSMGGYKITNLATPTAANDAANKSYVDSTASGLSVKDSVKYATTTALTYSTYTYPGADAVGAKMTSAPGATLTIDGATPSIGDRVLVKNETNADRNGIYERKSNDGTSWVLERTTDFDENSEVLEGSFIFVTNGSTNASTGWVLSDFDGTLSIDGAVGDSLVFTQFSGAGTYNAGNGIVVDGTDIHFAQATPYAIGDLFYADGTSSVGTLSDVATGSVLISGGVGAAPSWGKIGLTSHVSGTLAATNGGTGISSYTAGDLIYAISSDTLDKLNLGTDDQVLKVSGGKPSWGWVDFSDLTGELLSSQMCVLSGDVSNALGSGVITVEKLTRQTEINAANLPDFTGLKAFFYTDGSSGYPDAYAYGGGIYFSRLDSEGTGRRGSWQMVSKMAEELQFYIRKVVNSGANEWSSWFKIWHSGNDGSGSGLEADLLDGFEGAYYLDPANLSSVVPASKGGTGSQFFQADGLSGTARTVTFKNMDHTVPAFYASTVTGNNVDTAFTITHGLSTRDLIVMVRDTTTQDVVYVDVEMTSDNTIEVSFAEAPSSEDVYRVVMCGY